MWHQILLLTLTAVAGIIGTVFENKSISEVNGNQVQRFTVWGRLAISIIIISLSLSIYIEWRNESKAKQEEVERLIQLKHENEQRQHLVQQLEGLSEAVNLSIENLSENIDAVKRVEVNLIETSSIQIKQQKDLGKEIDRFSDSVEVELDRLASPLSELFFSFDIGFSNASEFAPDYFEFFRPEYIDQKGGLGIFPKQFPEDFNYEFLPYFNPNLRTVKIFKGIRDKDVSPNTFKKLAPDLAYNLIESGNKNITTDRKSVV